MLKRYFKVIKITQFSTSTTKELNIPQALTPICQSCHQEKSLTLNNSFVLTIPQALYIQLSQWNDITHLKNSFMNINMFYPITNLMPVKNHMVKAYSTIKSVYDRVI